MVYVVISTVDHLVNNAGIARQCSFKNVDSISKHTPIMARKAALISFFETLRMEMGGDIGITIVTPGLIKSEMSLSASSPKAIPMESNEECAKAIVKSGCRGDKYLVEPSWVRILFPWKAFCTELTEYCNRCLALISRDLKRGNVMMGKGSKINCKSASYKLFKDKANNRVDDLLGMFMDLQYVRKESRAADVVVLREQVHQDINFLGSAYNTFFCNSTPKAKIIAIASAAGRLHMPRMAYYKVSKAAVIALYETLKVEFGGDIGITIVTPGLI
ncbi:hypothetical protein Ddye_000898 [Dipteronia dyeriana]|uniref:Uncharacterized protein n=1 Tax=Dipteronia dyeriana TaxID=168575 RepID=A0AAD9XMI2_9ROSI|nr:hypothetical protein Ddye_000898 [Dipteronia dyeriana]